MSSRQATRHLIFALIAAAVLRLAALAVSIDPYRAPDSASFVLLTQSIVHENRMAYRDPGSPEVELRAFRSLFYPVFLAACEWLRAGTTGALILQALLGIAAIACMFFVARSVFGNEIAAATAWIGALYFSSIFYERQILTESLYTPILVFGVALAVFAFRRRERYDHNDYLLALVAGLVFGIAAITRPVGLIAAALTALVVALFAVLSGSQRRSLLLVAVTFVAGTTAVVGPALIRNYLALGRFTLSTSGGMNLWMGNVGSMQGAWQMMADNLSRMGEVDIDKWFYADTWARRGEIFSAFPQLFARKCWGLFAPATRELTGLPHRLILPFALAGIVLARPKEWRVWLVIGATYFAHIVLALTFVANPRYRSPIDPITWMLAAAGIVYLWKRGTVGRIAIAVLVALNLAVRLLLQH